MADVVGDVDVTKTPRLEKEVEAEVEVEQDGEESAQESSEEEPDEPSMVVSRARRSNAGRNLSKLIAQAEAEDEQDEIGAIFEEIADDKEFSGSDAEAPDDVSLNSSSDDEDDENEGDELQGEKDLQKQAHSEQRTKSKRKTMQMHYKPRPLKRVRVETSVSSITPRDSTEPTARPKKKSERVSWIPTPEEGPTRSSMRKLAVENKARTHERLKEKEKHRLRTLANMQAADARKEANKPKAMTQEDRLKEADRIEKWNSKSLTRWEETERKKEQERKEREAAGRRHDIDGPFIRTYSGPGIWLGDKYYRDGYKLAFRGRMAEEIGEEDDQPKEPATLEERVKQAEQEYNRKIQKRFRREQKAKEKEREEKITAALAAANPEGPPTDAPTAKPGEVIADTKPGEVLAQTALTSKPGEAVAQTVPPATATPQGEQASQEPPNAVGPVPPPAYPTNSIMFPPPQAPGLLDGIHYWATLPGDKAPDNASSTNGQPAQLKTPYGDLDKYVDPRFFVPLTPAPAQGQAQAPAPALPPPLPPAQPPPYVNASVAMRTLIYLANFDSSDSNAAATSTGRIRKKDADADATMRILFPHNEQAHPMQRGKNTTTAKLPQICAITSKPARYRDPVTELQYHDSYAYKCIKRLVQDGCQCELSMSHCLRTSLICTTSLGSNLLGCFVGTVHEPQFGRPAMGVPDIFIKKAEEGMA